MASIASFISYSSPLLHPCFPLTSSSPFPSLSFSNSNHTTRFTCSVNSRRNFAIFASSASPGWELSDADDNPRSKTSVLFNLIQEIEPLDVSVIQKDVPPTTIDAIKRTISGMLGLLPSDQFQVMVEALWEPLFKLLISSMMTGYTLRNAEYRLFLERNLEIHDENMDKSNSHDFHIEAKGTAIEGEEKRGSPGQESVPTSKDTRELMYSIPDFGEMTPEAREYILKLHSSLSSVKKELRDVKRKTAALQMQQFVGEEKNDLLDYLRSLEPEKVAELSEPTSPELKDMIHSVVHGLLATLSPKMHSKGPDMGENPPKGTLDVQTEGDCIDLVENTSLQFQPLISLPRDYLARLLFWSMLLGHYVRGLEYRLELMDLMSLPCAATGNSLSDEQFV